MVAKARLWEAEARRPRTGITRGRYSILIRTTIGWSTSRDRFRSLRKAKQSALWFLSCSGVESVRILDGEQVIDDMSKPRKPR